MEVVGTIIVFSILVAAFFRTGVAIFSDRVSEDKSKQTKFSSVWLWVGPLGFLIISATLFHGAYVGIRPPSKEMRTRNMEEQIQTAAANYAGEYGVLPSVADNASFINALEGANPRGIAFLTIKPSDQNAKGEALDGWGTPLRIVVQKGSVLVQSAGPDRTWGTADDKDSSQMPSP